MSEEKYRVGEYWLLQRPRRSDVWQIAWMDRESNQRRLRSTGTSDFQEAMREIHKFAYENMIVKNAEPEELSVCRVLLDYWNDHAKNIASAEAQRIALNYWREFFDGKKVSDLDRHAQTEFVKSLKEKGHSPGYISRTLSAGRAAVRFAWKSGVLTAAPYIMDVETEADRRSKTPKGRPMSIEEVGRLLDEMKSQHMLTFCMLMLNTMSRPDAVLDLQVGQCDFENKLIQLNPPGRRQTKKHRPTIPMTTTVMPWLQQVEEGYIVNYNGAKVNSVKKAWQRARERAGLDVQVNPYSFRHTMARELRRSRVSETEIDIMLGHMPPGKKTSLIYAPFEPDYCMNAIEAISGYVRRLQGHTRQAVELPNTEQK